MPRKRKTRAAPARKAVAGIGEPIGDEAKQDKADREEAIAVLKQDFAQELKAREKKLEKELQAMTKSFKAAHRTTMIALPSFIQKMTIREFLAYGGNVEGAAKAAAACSVAESAAVTQKSPAATVSRAALAEVTNQTVAEMPPPTSMITDDTALAMETPAATIKTRAKRKPAGAVETTALRARSTRRTRQTEIDIGDTPAPGAPTPAFDPRLLGLHKGAAAGGRTRAKTKREPTIALSNTNRDDYLTTLHAFANGIPEAVDGSDNDVIQAYKNLQARLTIALGSSTT